MIDDMKHVYFFLQADMHWFQLKIIMYFLSKQQKSIISNNFVIPIHGRRILIISNAGRNLSKQISPEQLLAYFETPDKSYDHS